MIKRVRERKKKIATALTCAQALTSPCHAFGCRKNANIPEGGGQWESFGGFSTIFTAKFLSDVFKNNSLHIGMDSLTSGFLLIVVMKKHGSNSENISHAVLRLGTKLWWLRAPHIFFFLFLSLSSGF